MFDVGSAVDGNLLNTKYTMDIQVLNFFIAK